MMNNLVEAMKSRRSTRTFDGVELSAQELQDLKDFLRSIETPFAPKVEFRVLDGKTQGVKSPVVVGATTYVAAKVKREQDAELAIGYAFELFCLEAAVRGFGTVMLAASLSRKAFEREMEVGADEVMPVASPVGHPAQAMSLREKMMRKAIKADERLPFESLFYNETFQRPLAEADSGAFELPLSMTRLAPSATNRQPWRVVLTPEGAHFYEARTLKESALGDIQKVDMGIAMAHFDVAARVAGLEGEFVLADPGIQAPEGVEYVRTYKL